MFLQVKWKIHSRCLLTSYTTFCKVLFESSLDAKNLRWARNDCRNRTTRCNIGGEHADVEQLVRRGAM